MLSMFGKSPPPPPPLPELYEEPLVQLMALLSVTAIIMTIILFRK